MNNQNIDVLVVEPTNECDLNCIYCPKREKREMNIDFFRDIIVKNNCLERRISNIELGGMGNPLLHKNIKQILQLLKNNDLFCNILTNGLGLKDKVAFFDDNLLSKVHFSIYLDHPDEEKNDEIMGKKCYKKTIESFEYIKRRKLDFDIIMRIIPQNYDKIEDMLRIAKHYGAKMLIPIEVFPFSDEKFILTDETKRRVIEKINQLKNMSEPVHKTIHFEYPPGNCTYLRKKRLFISSSEELGFCHFLSYLPANNKEKIKDKFFDEIIEFNNRIRDEFVKKKQNEINSWQLPRKTASPCSYCLQKIGYEKRW
ncbi:MAG: radical SAM protein [Candidatus Aenigmarchaeota archaeon]|nr:radical SAM protein [Candidatus Aenigmarchaeota archaeon]